MRLIFYFLVICTIPLPLVAGDVPDDCPEPPADSDAAAATAGKWFQTGIEHAAAEEFEAAGRAFKCSDRLVPHPATLLNVANAAEHAADTSGAEAAYTEFLRRYPEDSRAPAVRASLEALRPGVDTALGEDASDSTSPVKNGTNHSETDSVHNNEAQPTVVLPKKQNPPVQKPQVEIAHEQKPDRKVRAMRTSGFTLLSTGAATLVTGVITGAFALSYDRDLAEACDHGECGEAQWEKLDAMKGLATATNVLLAVGGTMTVIGTALPIAANRLEKKTKRAVSAVVTPYAGVSSFGVGIQGAF